MRVAEVLDSREHLLSFIFRDTHCTEYHVKEDAEEDGKNSTLTTFLLRQFSADEFQNLVQQGEMNLPYLLVPADAEIIICGTHHTCEQKQARIGGNLKCNK